MTTHSDISQIEPYWFGRSGAEARARAEDRPEQWALVPGYSRYLWSDKGRVRRARDGYDLSLNKLSSAGYRQVNVTDDTGRRVTVDVAPMILLAHHPAFLGLDRFPGGLETRHNPAVGDKTFNAYPEGIWPGTKAQNAADKYPDGPPAYFPCKNAPRCLNEVPHEGRRCADCAAEVGRQAAALLSAGENLADVAAFFGYKRTDWTYRLAVRHGRYAGTQEQALAQRPGVTRRLLLRFQRESILQRAAADPGGEVTRCDYRLRGRSGRPPGGGDSA